MWHILRHLTHSSGDMATICYIFIGEQPLTNLTGALKKSEMQSRTRPSLQDKRGEWGSGVTMLLRYNTGQYIVTTTTIRHPKSAGVSSFAV